MRPRPPRADDAVERTRRRRQHRRFLADSEYSSLARLLEIAIKLSALDRKISPPGNFALAGACFCFSPARFADANTGDKSKAEFLLVSLSSRLPLVHSRGSRPSLSINQIIPKRLHLLIRRVRSASYSAASRFVSACRTGRSLKIDRTIDRSVRSARRHARFATAEIRRRVNVFFRLHPAFSPSLSLFLLSGHLYASSLRSR